jgi:3-hydroxyacyl-[acyl-carrier-protein] dehydratase
MDFPAVESLIPHRGLARVIERIVAQEGATLVAERRFTPADVPGHFPGNPIVPGVVMIEGLAQALACLAGLQGYVGRVFLVGVEKVRFRSMAIPPCTLRFHVEATEHRFGMQYAKGRVEADGRVVCTAQFQAALVDSPEPPGTA